jgi:hypothetical protein
VTFTLTAPVGLDMLAGHLTGYWRFATDGDSSAVARTRYPPLCGMCAVDVGQLVAAHNWIICKQWCYCGSASPTTMRDALPGHGEYVAKSALGLLVKSCLCNSVVVCSCRVVHELIGGLMMR